MGFRESIFLYGDCRRQNFEGTARLVNRRHHCVFAVTKQCGKVVARNVVKIVRRSFRHCKNLARRRIHDKTRHPFRFRRERGFFYRIFDNALDIKIDCQRKVAPRRRGKIVSRAADTAPDKVGFRQHAAVDSRQIFVVIGFESALSLKVYVRESQNLRHKVAVRIISESVFRNVNSFQIFFNDFQDVFFFDFFSDGDFAHALFRDFVINLFIIRARVFGKRSRNLFRIFDGVRTDVNRISRRRIGKSYPVSVVNSAPPCNKRQISVPLLRGARLQLF